MAIPAYINHTIHLGSKFTHVFEVQNPDTSAKDLSGFSARLQIRATESSDAVLYSAETSGDLVVDGPAGTVTWTVGANTSSAWEFSEGVYALEIYTDEVNAYRLAQGVVTTTAETVR